MQLGISMPTAKPPLTTDAQELLQLKGLAEVSDSCDPMSLGELLQTIAQTFFGQKNYVDRQFFTHA